MKKVIVLTCTLLIIACSLLACDTGNNILTAPLPFTVSGGHFELRGNSTGYTPGGTYDFKLSIRNNTDEDWKGNCYVFLIDKNGPLMDISNVEFDLYTGGQEDTVIQMTLPVDIEPGAYGLTLLFPDKGSTVQTIYVGKNLPDEPAGPWPDISSYKQSPATIIREELTVDDFVKQPHYSWVATADVGDNIIVTLGSNLTTGFKWPDTAQIYNQDILTQIDYKFVEPEQTEVVGASGKEVWTFKAMKKGTTTISMEYRRPWENAEKAEWAFVATITIQ